MPHFVIHCSKNVLEILAREDILKVVYQTAMASQLFGATDVKVRLITFDDYLIAENQNGFLHIFGHIMQGRSIEQRQELSRAMIAALKPLLKDLSILSMNISEFEKSTYMNRTMIS